MKKILLISDTHGYIDNVIIKYAKWADEVWHAGDIGSIKIIDELKKYSFLRAVYGNIDDNLIRSLYPKNNMFKCEGLNVLITHIGGYPNNYAKDIPKLLITNKIKIFISWNYVHNITKIFLILSLFELLFYPRISNMPLIKLHWPRIL